MKKKHRVNKRVVTKTKDDNAAECKKEQAAIAQKLDALRWAKLVKAWNEKLGLQANSLIDQLVLVLIAVIMVLVLALDVAPGLRKASYHVVGDAEQFWGRAIGGGR